MSKTTFLMIGACLLAWLSLMSGLLAWAPTLEARLFPPVKEISMSDIERNGRSFCWDITQRKTRDALLRRSDFWIDYGTGPRIQVQVTLNGLPTPTGFAVESGVILTFGPFCTDLPVENGHVLVDVVKSESRIINTRVYIAPFWDLLVTIPPIPIPKAPVLYYSMSDDNPRDIGMPPCSQCHGRREK